MLACSEKTPLDNETSENHRKSSSNDQATMLRKSWANVSTITLCVRVDGSAESLPRNFMVLERKTAPFTDCDNPTVKTTWQVRFFV